MTVETWSLYHRTMVVTTLLFWFFRPTPSMQKKEFLYEQTHQRKSWTCPCANVAVEPAKAMKKILRNRRNTAGILAIENCFDNLTSDI